MRRMTQRTSDAAKEISRRLQLAMLLEVSAYPKPGNVHRTRDYSDTRFEHFVASAVASGSYFECAARNGALISKRKRSLEKAGIGCTIRDAIISIMRSQRGGNTSLGTITLLVPLAVAAGMTFTGRGLSLSGLRRNLAIILRATSVTDAVAFYDAVARAKPGGLGSVPTLDVRDPASRRKILNSRLSLLDVFRLAADRDSICSEWTTDYEITFGLGYPYLRRELSRTADINVATVNTYLKILSEIPDTLIARKAGLQTTTWVSRRARKALALGGANTNVGRKEIEKLDEDLRRNGHLLNPGATADISAAVVALATLSGYRP